MICQNIFRQIFEELVSVKISPIKILHYTVYTIMTTVILISW